MGCHGQNVENLWTESFRGRKSVLFVRTFGSRCGNKIIRAALHTADMRYVKITERLSMLLLKNIRLEAIIQVLDENQDIPVTEAIRREGNSMCNYSSYVFSEGEKKGLEQGIILGAIDTMRDYGVSEEKILQRIMKKYQILEEDAKRLMEEAKSLSDLLRQSSRRR